jgi:hypothetical protein
VIHHDVTQGEVAWFRARLGIPTASCFDKILTKAKLDLSKQAVEYADTLLAEWVLQEPVETYEGTQYQNRGIEMEPEAAAWFAFDQGLAPDDVQTVGFCTLDDRLAGCSPDRFVRDDALLEIKCKGAKGHMKARRDPEWLLKEHRLQVYGQMWVTGRRTCWLVSYNPKLTSVVLKVEWDDGIIGKIKEAVTAFVADLDARKQAESPEEWARRGR